MHQSLKPTKRLTIHNPMYITLSHKPSTDPSILYNLLYDRPHRLLPLLTTMPIPINSPPLPLIPGNTPHHKRRACPSNQPHLIPRLRRRRP